MLAGDTISINLTRTSGGANQCFRLVEPDGGIQSYTCVGFAVIGYQAAVSRDIRLTKSGTHVIQVVDGDFDQTLNYNLDVECFGGCPSPGTCAFAVSRNAIGASQSGDSVGVLVAASAPACSWSARR